MKRLLPLLLLVGCKSVVSTFTPAPSPAAVEWQKHYEAAKQDFLLDIADVRAHRRIPHQRLNVDTKWLIDNTPQDKDEAKRVGMEFDLVSCQYVTMDLAFALMPKQFAIGKEPMQEITNCAKDGKP